MSKPTRTALTLSLLTEVGRLTLNHKFRPLDNADYDCFADASDEARIAFGGDELETILLLLNDSKALPSGDINSVAVIVDGNRIELHGCAGDGEPLVATLDLGVGY
jgi:hypothetical protein